MRTRERKALDARIEKMDRDFERRERERLARARRFATDPIKGEVHLWDHERAALREFLADPNNVPTEDGSVRDLRPNGARLIRVWCIRGSLVANPLTGL